MLETANILVVGCGAVGTMCAFALQKSKATTVTGVFRSNFEEVQRMGLCIRSVDHGTVLGWKPHHGKSFTVNTSDYQEEPKNRLRGV